MKKFAFYIASLLISQICFGQKQINDPNAVLRTVGSFSGISVSNGIDLYVSKGAPAVAVSGNTTDLTARIKTEVVDGVLKIYLESKSGVNINWGSNQRLRAYVAYETLKSLQASGGSDVAVEGIINTTDFTLSVSGGSDFKGAVEATTLTVKQSGGSDISITGKAGTITVQASGGSDFNGYDMVADVCNVQASGGSDIHITANKEIVARASGASDVYYKGTATVRDVKASGASSVQAKSKP